MPSRKSKKKISFTPRAALLRAARAGLGLEQVEVAGGAGISESTLYAAEKDRACTDKTWELLVSFFSSRGAQIGDVGGQGVLLLSI